MSPPLADDELRLIDAYWRAANYLSVGQIYLLDNPLLREPLRLEHIKPRLLGHWGTTPGLNLIYAHMNRVIRARDLDAIYVAGPGHGGPGARREHLSRGHLQRGLSGHLAATPTACAGCSASSRSPAASRATSRPRRPARSTRAASSATRSSHAYGAAFDNPGPARLLRRRRRRGRDRPARGELALEQVPQPGTRRRGAPDPAPQRLQDRQPDRARAHPATRSSTACSRATGTSRASSRATIPRRAPGDGRGARRLPRRDRRDPGARPRRRADAAALADDRPAHAEGRDHRQARASVVLAAAGARLDGGDLVRVKRAALVHLRWTEARLVPVAGVGGGSPGDVGEERWGHLVAVELQVGAAPCPSRQGARSSASSPRAEPSPPRRT